MKTMRTPRGTERALRRKFGKPCLNCNIRTHATMRLDFSLEDGAVVPDPVEVHVCDACQCVYHDFEELEHHM